MRDTYKAVEVSAPGTKGKLKMRTKLQLSKNVTMNKPDEKRTSMTQATNRWKVGAVTVTKILEQEIDFPPG